MTTPGSNLLRQALTVILRQNVAYLKANGRSLNNVGQFITTYDPQVVIFGSFQPVPRQLYEQYGLDLQKNYYTLYAPNAIIDIARDVSNDLIKYNGIVFQCESNNDWFAPDGWKGVLCCQLNVPNVVSRIFGFNANNPYVNFNHGNLYYDGQ